MKCSRGIGEPAICQPYVQLVLEQGRNHRRLFVSQRDHGIDLHGAACGDVRCDKSNSDEHEDGESECRRIVGRQAEEELSRQAGNPDGAEDTRSDAGSEDDRGITHDQTKDRSLLRAEGHANADLVRPLRDRVRHRAVKPDSSEQEREAAEEAGNDGH